jgi:hypothetical protein
VVIGGGDRRRLLEHQLPAVIEALQGTRDREGYDMMRTPNFVAALKMAGAKSLVEPLKRASAGLT